MSHEAGESAALASAPRPAAADATAAAAAPGLAAATAPGPGADRDLPLDAHLHTNLSHDSDVPLDVYCAEAVARGIPEIAITDHVDFDPRAPDHSFASFAAREREAREAAARWADRGLRVLFGIEVTYESHCEADIREHLARHPYDYAIGSVHVMAYSPYIDDRVAGWVAGRSFDEIVAPYFAEVEAAIRSELFDTVGHLDYVKKYLADHVPPSAFAARPDVYEPLLRALVETGTGLEVNASGLRQAPRETYPAPWSWSASGSSGARSSRPAPTPTAPPSSPSGWPGRTKSPRRRGSRSSRSGGPPGRRDRRIAWRSRSGSAPPARGRGRSGPRRRARSGPRRDPNAVTAPSL